MTQISRVSLILLLTPTLETFSQNLGDYPVQPVPRGNVRLSDSFWTPRLDTNASATIPHLFEQCQTTGRIDNFMRAAGNKSGSFEGWWFNDSDVYKSIEAAAYMLALHRDPVIEATVDSVIEKIASAQEPDGYLFTPRRTAAPDYRYARYIGKTRWDSVQHSHELYDLGHLYEAAVAYHEATGKRALLDVALKSAGLLLKVFGPEMNRRVPGHQEIEIGLVKLYRATGEEKYARLAKFFLDERGRGDGHRLYGEYSQDHLPVTEQSEAVGHAVRALYMYAGMADMVALFGDTAYAGALDRLWADVVGKKTYLTGGIGAAGGHEGFAGAYELPNLSAYCETCAAIASVLWNERMFRLYGDAKYVDVIERTLYNGLISGVSFDGRTFFYPNPLESDGRHARTPWFAVACCPPNIARILPQVAGMQYAYSGDRVFVNLFAGSTASIPLASGDLGLRMETGYPWDGKIRITVSPNSTEDEFTLSIRIPGWARNEAMPLGLYRFADHAAEGWSVSVNGKPAVRTTSRGYVDVKRMWKEGDVLELNLDMPVRRVVSREEVKANGGRVALQRGPIVYCVEAADAKGGHVSNLVLVKEAPPSEPSQNEGVFGRIGSVIRASVVGLHGDPAGAARREESEVTAIPYFAWAHRGTGEMSVWLAQKEEFARPVPAPTIASKATATSSEGDATAMNDQRDPQSSTDRTFRYLHWWPNKGTEEWAQYDFEAPTLVSSVEIYWYDDTGIGECRVPRSWELLYKEGDEWKPVEAASGFESLKDRYNTCRFKPVRTRGLRVVVQLPDSFSSGIHEWRVGE